MTWMELGERVQYEGGGGRRRDGRADGGEPRGRVRDRGMDGGRHASLHTDSGNVGTSDSVGSGGRESGGLWIYSVVNDRGQEFQESELLVRRRGEQGLGSLAHCFCLALKMIFNENHKKREICSM